MKSGSFSKFQPWFYVVLGLLNFLGITTAISLNPDELIRISRATNEIKSGGCELPEQPDFGQWSILGGKLGKPKELAEADTVLKFDCNDSYKLSSESKFVVCYNGSWSLDEMPKCQKICPPLYSSKTTTIKCYDNRNVEIKCDEATDGNSASITCAPYYESPDLLRNNSKINRYCWSGSWNLPAPLCVPVCGEKSVTAVPLIVNGQNAKNGNYPWVTAIYQFQKNEYTFVCAGSMLTPRVILTVAHCVTTLDGTPVRKENIVVGVGKYYNKYKDPRDTQAQYSKIDKIIVPQTYKGDRLHYASDIALLITEDVLSLSSIVQPVCYQNLPSINLKDGIYGEFTGWGYTQADGSPSEELQELTIPFKSDSVCLQELPTDWADRYYTFDKFCAGHYNKSTAPCKGDTGGGLVFKNEIDARFYVHGILSVGHSVKGDCNIQISELYTKIASHYDWLEKTISQYL